MVSKERANVAFEEVGVLRKCARGANHEGACKNQQRLAHKYCFDGMLVATSREVFGAERGGILRLRAPLRRLRVAANQINAVADSIG